MTNQNVVECGIQTTGLLSVMISKCSFDSHQGGFDLHPVNVNNSFSRYTNDGLINFSNQRLQRRKGTRKDNKLALHCNFLSKPTLKGYRKRMMDIWEECACFTTTSQILADQSRIIIKKGWFSDLEILEIYQQINRETYQQYPKTKIEKINIKKQEY